MYVRLDLLIVLATQIKKKILSRSLPSYLPSTFIFFYWMASKMDDAALDKYLYKIFLPFYMLGTKPPP